jgi:hypothetical protein
LTTSLCSPAPRRSGLQIIIGDDELPTICRRQYEQIGLSYENPTICTVPHPGPSFESLTPDESEELA